MYTHHFGAPAYIQQREIKNPGKVATERGWLEWTKTAREIKRTECSVVWIKRKQGFHNDIQTAQKIGKKETTAKIHFSRDIDDNIIKIFNIVFF